MRIRKKSKEYRCYTFPSSSLYAETCVSPNKDLFKRLDLANDDEKWIPIIEINFNNKDSNKNVSIDLTKEEAISFANQLLKLAGGGKD